MQLTYYFLLVLAFDSFVLFDYLCVLILFVMSYVPFCISRGVFCFVIEMCFLLKYSKDGSKCFQRWLVVLALFYVLTFCHSFYVSWQKNIQGVSTVGCGGQLSLPLVPLGVKRSSQEIFSNILIYHYDDTTFKIFPLVSSGAKQSFQEIFS